MFIMINKKKLRENILNQPPINQNTEIDKKKTLAEKWFVNLRDQICNDFTKIEYNFKIKDLSWYLYYHNFKLKV